MDSYELSLRSHSDRLSTLAVMWTRLLGYESRWTACLAKTGVFDFECTGRRH